MNQQIKAIGAKTKWYNSHTSPYPQNQMFLKNHEQYFQQLNNDEEVSHQCEIPDFAEAQVFWSKSRENGNSGEW